VRCFMVLPNLFVTKKVGVFIMLMRQLKE
jgi:hypothetical protein